MRAPLGTPRLTAAALAPTTARHVPIRRSSSHGGNGGAHLGSKCPKCGSMSCPLLEPRPGKKTPGLLLLRVRGWFVASEHRLVEEPDQPQEAPKQHVPTPRQIFAGLEEHAIGQRSVKDGAERRRAQPLPAPRSREGTGGEAQAQGDRAITDDHLEKPLSLHNLAQLSGTQEEEQTSEKSLDVEAVELDKSNVLLLAPQGAARHCGQKP